MLLPEKLEKPEKSEWKSFHVRPEDEKTVEQFYTAAEAKRYAASNSMRRIQEGLTLRAVELMQLPAGSRVIDAGCGAGFSSVILSELCYEVFPFDVIPIFVTLCRKKGFDAKRGDVRKFPFASLYDGIVSISVLQWVSALGAGEVKKVAREFWKHLKTGGKAVVQFYPRDEGEAMQVGRVFKSVGFKTTVITDNPENARKRKVFLLLVKG
ncbi:MAG: class I SAM-dependent methyltransferase [Candidatus Micrarchaeota archaeon]